MTTTRPLPVPYAASAPFWAATAEGRLLIQRCSSGHLQFYPRGHCHRCGSRSLDQVEASGAGTLHTFSVVHRAGHDGFADRLPYVFAIVDLAEGPRVTANVIGADPGEVRVGMPLRAVFTDTEQGFTLPQFTPGRPA
jgi:uncharacterized protein